MAPTRRRRLIIQFYLLGGVVMTDMMGRFHEFMDGLVFGNGWLAFAALGLLAAMTCLVRMLPPLRV